MDYIFHSEFLAPDPSHVLRLLAAMYKLVLEVVGPGHKVIAFHTWRFLVWFTSPVQCML